MGWIGFYIIALKPKGTALQQVPASALKRFVWSQFLNIRRELARWNFRYAPNWADPTLTRGWWTAR